MMMRPQCLLLVLAVATGSFELLVEKAGNSAALGPQRAVAADPQDTEGAPVPPKAAVKPAAVKPLTVAYYDFSQHIPKGIDSLDDAKAFVAGNKPTLVLTLENTSISFPRDSERTANCDAMSLGEYLLGKKGFAEKLASKKKDEGLQRLSETINPRSIFVFSGFIDVTRPGDYTLKTPVDDGDEIRIGGVVIHQKSSFGGFTHPEDPAYLSRVTFAKPGIYPIEVLHWDREHELGIHVYSDLDPRGELQGQYVLLPVLAGPPKVGSKKK